MSSTPLLDPDNPSDRVYQLTFTHATEGGPQSVWVSPGPSNASPTTMEDLRDALDASADFSSVSVRKSQVGHQTL